VLSETKRARPTSTRSSFGVAVRKRLTRASPDLGAIRRIKELRSSVVITGDRGNGGKGEVTERQEIESGSLNCTELYRTSVGATQHRSLVILCGGCRYDDGKRGHRCPLDRLSNYDRHRAGSGGTQPFDRLMNWKQWSEKLAERVGFVHTPGQWLP